MVLAGASLGWAAAICAMVSSGSFGVPIKSEAARRLDIDPLVFQTYKTVVSLAFSCSVTKILGYPIFFSPWGIVSGLFWVPGGVATVVAVKILGLGLAIAVGNSLVAVVSFCWGIFIFHEKVHSKSVACVGVFMMVIGFTGMSFFSLKNRDCEQEKLDKVKGKDNMAKSVTQDKRGLQQPSDDDTYCSMTSLDDSCSTCSTETNTSESIQQESGSPDASPNIARRLLQRRRTSLPGSKKMTSSGDLPLYIKSGTTSHSQALSDQADDRFQLLCTSVSLSRWQAGLLIAIWGGIWGGSVLVPMQFCQQEHTGLGYLVSFSTGAFIVTLGLWLLRFLYHLQRRRSIKAAYEELPSLHLHEMWLPGGTSGLLWSVGNLFSLLAVQNLGEGVGYCAVQASMLVGGLWGIFYFKEVRKDMIVKWLLSALMTVSGILVLGYEHGS